MTPALGSPRVVHITSVQPAYDPRIFARACRTLAKAGYTVTLVAPRPDATEREDVRLVAAPELDIRWIRWAIAPFMYVIIALRQRGDIYHLHDPELIPVGVVLKLLGRRVIYDMHEHYPEIAAEQAPSLLKRLVRRIVTLAVVTVPRLSLDAAVFPTAALAHEVSTPDSAKSVVVRNLPVRNIVPDAFGPPTSSGYKYDVVFLGTVSPYRMAVMLDVARQTIEKRQGTRWLFLGIPERTVSWIRSNYGQELFMSNVDIVGRVNHAQVLQELARCNIGFNFHVMGPRFDIALPNKVFEYMACGQVVVSTRFPELADLLREEEAVLIDGVDPASYANAILEKLSDTRAADDMRKAARDAVRTRLNWESSEANRLLSLYSRLLS